MKVYKHRVRTTFETDRERENNYSFLHDSFSDKPYYEKFGLYLLNKKLIFRDYNDLVNLSYDEWDKLSDDKEPTKLLMMLNENIETFLQTQYKIFTGKRFIATWGEGYVKKGTEEKQLSFFDEYF